MQAFNTKKYIADRSAFSIDQKFVDWAESTVFDQYTADWCSRYPTHYYTVERYFPPNPKKFGDQSAVINFLKLQDSPPKDILDIGTGAGYFCKLSKQLGHNAEGTEIQSILDEPIVEVYKHYDITVSELTVRKNQKIELTKDYDYITAIRSMFNYLPTHEYFLEKDWLYFKDNLLEYIKPGGAIFLKTNYKFFKNSITPEQQEIVNAFGEPLLGWNSFTYFIKK